MRDGAARLTVDAVAAAAGISKASVLYDYKSKQELIKAVIERKVTEEVDRLDAAMARIGPVPNARVLAHLANAADAVSDDRRAVAVNLCAALAQDAEMRCLSQQSLRHEVAMVLESSDHPRSALLAFLAVQGLTLLELLGLHAWPEAERQRILHEIGELARRNLPSDRDDSANSPRFLHEDVS